MGFEPPKGLPTVFDPSYKGVGQKVGLEIWRVEQLKVIKKPPNENCYQGQFHEGDAYIILQTKAKGNGLERHIFFWLGKDSSQDEQGVAAYKTVELDESLGGEPVQHREVQAFESDEFLSLFKGGVRYLEGGVATGFKHVDREAFTKRLLHVKGRRKVRVSQVKIDAASINEGDVFILDDGRMIVQWNGKDASRVEKVKALEVCKSIRDQERGGNAEIIAVDQGKEDGAFWTGLGVNKPARIKAASDGGDDEAHSRAEAVSVKLFKISDASSKLEMTEISTRPLKKELLDTNDAFILDEGANVFIWVGKNASQSEKLHSMKLATDYLAKAGKPNSTPIQRVVEGAETPLFKQTFEAWPEANALKPGATPTKKAFEKKAFDVKSQMVKGGVRETVSLPDDGTGKLEIWRVEDFKKVDWPKERYGEFYSGDSYVMLYTYLVNSKENYIVYFWQGLQSSQDEKGASALLAKEIDDNLGGAAVQIRVVQNKEPPHLYLLFKGKMVIHSGGKASGWKNQNDKDSYDTDGTRLFQVKGTNEYNTRAIQVVERAASLNSGDVFILETPKGIFLWNGKAASGDEREVAKNLAKVVTKKSDFQLVVEGQEPAAFWDAIGGKGTYATVKESADQEFREPRLFQASNNRGYFYVEEIFDYDQEDLIEEDVMILDTFFEVFVWIGSKANAEEKKGALTAAIDYIKTDGSSRTEEDTAIIVIKQGFEPPNFTCHFHAWDPAKWSQGMSYEQMVASLGSGAAAVSAKDELSKFTGARKYTAEQLSAATLPEGVDATQKEQYLADDEFKKIFGITKAEFNSQPAWKRNNLKKKVGLF